MLLILMLPLFKTNIFCTYIGPMKLIKFQISLVFWSTRYIHSYTCHIKKKHEIHEKTSHVYPSYMA